MKTRDPRDRKHLRKFKFQFIFGGIKKQIQYGIKQNTLKVITLVQNTDINHKNEINVLYEAAKHASSPCYALLYILKQDVKEVSIKVTLSLQQLFETLQCKRDVMLILI